MKRKAKAKSKAARATRSFSKPKIKINAAPKTPENQKRVFESGRQWFHILFGAALLIAALALGPHWTQIGYLGGLLIGLIILHLKLQQIPLPFIDLILARFERPGVLFPGQGALMYFAGGLFVFSFTPFHFALAIVSIVAFGDGFATLVGLYGKWKLPWNPHKTVEGLIAFIVSAAVIGSLVILPLHAIAYAAALGLMETLDIPADDNLLLPLAATVLYYAFPI